MCSKFYKDELMWVLVGKYHPIRVCVNHNDSKNSAK